jgi:hypothetical protein
VKPLLAPLVMMSHQKNKKKTDNNNKFLAVTQLFSTYHLSLDTTPLFSLDSTFKHIFYFPQHKVFDFSYQKRPVFRKNYFSEEPFFHFSAF